MLDYHLIAIAFWLSLTAQYTAVAVWVWADRFGWSWGRLALTAGIPFAIVGITLMVGIGVLSSVLERRKIVNKDHRLHQVAVPFGWALLGGLAYGPPAVMWLRVVRGWDAVAAWSAGIVSGLVGSMVMTLLIVMVWLILFGLIISGLLLISNINRKLRRESP